MKFRFCMFCGALIEPGSKKCIRCGADLELQEKEFDFSEKRNDSVIILPWSGSDAFSSKEDPAQNTENGQPVTEPAASVSDEPIGSLSADSNSLPSFSEYVDNVPDFGKMAYKTFYGEKAEQQSEVPPPSPSAMSSETSVEPFPAFSAEPPAPDPAYATPPAGFPAEPPAPDPAYATPPAGFSAEPPAPEPAFASRTADQDGKGFPDSVREKEISVTDSSAEYGRRKPSSGNIDQEKWNQWMYRNMELMSNLRGMGRGKKPGKGRIFSRRQ